MLSSDRRQDDEGEPSGEEVTTTIRDKYKAAAHALNKTIGVVMAACIPGASVLKICQLGDSMITENLEGFYNKGCKEKGLAFPTCLSVNRDVCYVCPDEDDDTVLKDKDMIRIEIACHIDGYIASQAHSLLVTPNPLIDTVAGRAADVICAVNKGAEIISDVVRPGTKMEVFNEIVDEVASSFRCKVLEISGCRLLKQYEALHSSCSIPSEGKFEKDRAYMVDIAFASEEGELEFSDERHTTVYRSTIDDGFEIPNETLPIFDEIKKKFPKMPFCVRSLDSFTRPSILACTKHGILEPYHVRHLKLGLVAQTRFTLLVRTARTASITEAPQQLLKPMIPVETLGDIDKLWTKLCHKNKGKRNVPMKLSYCGRLAVGEESCGFKPYISDISWNTTGHWGGASEALACTGTFGTHVYFRSKDIFKHPNIEDEWQQVVIQDIPGRFCKWSPDGKCLAVGVVTDEFDLPEVHAFYWDHQANNFVGGSIYKGTYGSCVFLNSLSWSHDSRFLVVPSDQTHHIAVLKVEKRITYVHPVRFSENKERLGYFCAAFHSRLTLFIAASRSGLLKLYEIDESKVKQKKKADIWKEDGKEWDDDQVGTLDLSFCTKGKDNLVCARSDWTVKIWSFNYDALGQNTALSPLHIIEAPNGYGNLSVRWTNYLAVGDGRQVISIYGHEDTTKLCGNEHSADVSARFNQAAKIGWRPMQSVLASGGPEGFILFWCLHTGPSDVVLAAKQRNIHVENLYYTHKPLQHGAASAARQAFEEFEKSQATMKEEFEKAVAESDMKHNQLVTISALANSGLSKISDGSASMPELADFFKEIVRLSTKQTL